MGPLFEPVCAAMHFVNLCRPCVDFRCVLLNAVPLRYTSVPGCTCLRERVVRPLVTLSPPSTLRP